MADALTNILKDRPRYPEEIRAIRAARGGKMTKEVYQIYSKQVIESGGFDVDDFADCWALGKIIPYNLNEVTLAKISHFSEVAIAEYNKEENANFEFVEVEKANVQLAGYVHYYVTFKAKNKDDVDGMAQTFQALISQPPAEVDVVDVEFCRLKPKPGQGGTSCSKQYPIYL